ncbi:hypothetical protein MishRS11D_02470 [Methylomagnum ishizawai]|nr:hypothetical protein MishRS11D_02470 [Methylomagnum ishizawai]
MDFQNPAEWAIRAAVATMDGRCLPKRGFAAHWSGKDREILAGTAANRPWKSPLDLGLASAGGF